MKNIKEKKPEIVKWTLGSYEGDMEVGSTIRFNSLSPEFYITEIKGKDIFGYYIKNYYGR